MPSQPGQHHGATVNDTCGFHVHLKPDHDDFDLPTLKHLAYIIVMYEQQIDSLQPSYRRAVGAIEGSGGRYDFRSNTSNFVDRSSGQRYSLAIVRGMISAVQNVRSLDILMGPGKRFVVNFENLRRENKNEPRTLEFRQHEGVLRGEMVEMWVYFCIALLRIANHAGTQQTDDELNPINDFNAQCQIYPFSEWSSSMSVWDLFDLMEIENTGALRTYFQRRSAYFALDKKLLRPDSPSSPPTSDPPADSDVIKSEDQRSDELSSQQYGDKSTPSRSPLHHPFPGFPVGLPPATGLPASQLNPFSSVQDQGNPYAVLGPYTVQQLDVQGSTQTKGAFEQGPLACILPNAFQTGSQVGGLASAVIHTSTSVQTEVIEAVHSHAAPNPTNPVRSALGNEADDLPDYVSPPPVGGPDSSKQPTVSPLTTHPPPRLPGPNPPQAGGSKSSKQPTVSPLTPYQPSLPAPTVPATARTGLPGRSPPLSGWREPRPRQDSSESP